MPDGPYEKLAIKLWETIVDKAVCGVFRPGQIKREGLASATVARNQIIMLAQADVDAEKIRSGLLISKVEGGEVVLKNNLSHYEPILDLPSMYAAVKDDLVLKHIQTEINLAKTVLKAEKVLLKDNSEPSDENVELDWVNRWRDYACNISSDEVQELWARLLAGEVKSPGKYSFRTMEFLKNITKQEAKEIEGVMPFIFKEGFIYRGYLESLHDGVLSRTIHKWLSWDVLYRMQELGVLMGITDETATITLHSIPGEKFFLRSADKAIIYEMPEGRVCKETYISVTKLGVELLDISGVKSNDEYIDCVAKQIKKSGGDVQISDYRELPGGKIECVGIINI
ncbi:DUF2806 domain-containing protein [Erwinia billingiae]|uniref:DUF2806 domain-containing protein n=1 Tax=Erwinia billingiae TaxID=182337 RepID=UPI001244F0D2|nr:DUF2806 domain-containing protein [Erwinia billingiae]QEW33236.1 DUF2806 domain-containing protein [Erwinia billingiae]